MLTELTRGEGHKSQKPACFWWGERSVGNRPPSQREREALETGHRARERERERRKREYTESPIQQFIQQVIRSMGKTDARDWKELRAMLPPRILKELEDLDYPCRYNDKHAWVYGQWVRKDVPIPETQRDELKRFYEQLRNEIVKIKLFDSQSLPDNGVAEVRKWIVAHPDELFTAIEKGQEAPAYVIRMIYDIIRLYLSCYVRKIICQGKGNANTKAILQQWIGWVNFVNKCTMNQRKTTPKANQEREEKHDALRATITAKNLTDDPFYPSPPASSAEADEAACVDDEEAEVGLRERVDSADSALSERVGLNSGDLLETLNVYGVETEQDFKQLLQQAKEEGRRAAAADKANETNAAGVTSHKVNLFEQQETEQCEQNVHTPAGATMGQRREPMYSGRGRGVHSSNIPYMSRQPVDWDQRRRVAAAEAA